MFFCLFMSWQNQSRSEWFRYCVVPAHKLSSPTLIPECEIPGPNSLQWWFCAAHWGEWLFFLMAGHPHFWRGQTPVLKSTHFDSKRLIKILLLCKRLAVLLSGEKLRAEPHCTAFTSVCDGAPPSPGWPWLRYFMAPLSLALGQSRGWVWSPPEWGCWLLQNGGASWLQGGSKKSIFISLWPWHGQSKSGGDSWGTQRAPFPFLAVEEILIITCHQVAVIYNAPGRTIWGNRRGKWAQYPKEAELFFSLKNCMKTLVCTWQLTIEILAIPAVCGVCPNDAPSLNVCSWSKRSVLWSWCQMPCQIASFNFYEDWCKADL